MEMKLLEIRQMSQLAPMSRFAEDMFRHVTEGKMSISAVVAVKPYDQWRALAVRRRVPKALRRDWMRSWAAAEYFPISQEDRLRILGNVSQAPPEDFAGQYDSYLSSDTWIWIRHRPDPVVPTTDLEMYILVTSVVTRLVPWVRDRRVGAVMVIPYEERSANLFDQFRATMSQSAFDERYAIFRP